MTRSRLLVALLLAVAVAGVATVTPRAAAQGQTIKIGTIFDHSGPFSAAGAVMNYRGVKLAIDWANDHGGVAGKLAQPAVAKGGVALATVLVVPGDEKLAAAVRALGEKYRGEVGVSAWNGFAVVRFCARDGAALRHDLVEVFTAVRGARLPHLWSN